MSEKIERSLLDELAERVDCHISDFHSPILRARLCKVLPEFDFGLYSLKDVNETVGYILEETCSFDDHNLALKYLEVTLSSLYSDKD